jgi:predicted metal-binding membrane protein
MADLGYGAEIRVSAVTVAAAAGCWVIAVNAMRGMDMGASTSLGSFGFFAGVWIAMMAAMMLPGVTPAVARYARTRHSSAPAISFAATYLAIWAAAGLVVYAVDRPHGATTAALATLAAGGYELTPMKRRARLRCQAPVRSGAHLGVYCLGSNAGLMAILLAVGAMSTAWMAVIAAVMLGQKLLPPRAVIDLPIAVAIVGFGLVMLLDPSSVPGLLPAM